MRKPGWRLLAAISFPLVLSAQAQDKANTANQGSGTGQGSGIVVSQGRSGVVGGVIAGFSGLGFGGQRGAPFSADTIDETDQFLADGNHIHQETHGKIYRDSEGRTRNENELNPLGMGRTFVTIHIFDPVEKTMILLNSEQKTATVHHFGGPAAGATQTRPVQSANSAASGTGQTGGLIKNLREMQRSQEDLGTMELEGFTVHGTRNSFTVPAGSMGNDKPMTTTNERWCSEDLKVELLTKSESPQGGKNVHKVINIRSGDPDPLLFQVPADYTVHEQPQR